MTYILSKHGTRGASDRHSPRRQHSWNNWHGLLVHTVSAADMVQLEAEEHRWFARIDDVPVGNL